MTPPSQPKHHDGEPPDSAGGDRLHKVLARAGVASRRACEELILAGAVTVNGQPVTRLGLRIDPTRDRVAINGRPVAVATPLVYLALHKPVGYITTANDEFGRRTVFDLAPNSPRLFPVGRLDADSEGLLLLTNDGELAMRLTHPRYEVAKTYRALVAGQVSPIAARALVEGIEIEGQRTAPARIEIVSLEPDQTELLLTIHEGRKRQVRLMLAEVGHPVLRLRRERLGPLRLGDLPLGRWRPLEAREVAALRQAVGLAG